jgi:TetR/AcrR family transcriptional regulator, cholesterol catabolism regulator
MRRRGPKRVTSNGLSRSDRRILLIATTAARLFSTKGYIETSMEDVAAASKISKGGMYHYFSSKDDLLYFVLSGFMNLVLENVEQELEGIESPVEKIRFIVFRHVKIYTEHMYSARTLLNEAHSLSAPRFKEVKSKEREYFAIIARILSSYLGPRVDNDRLRIVTFTLLGMCNWIYSWYNPKGRTSPDQLSQIIFEIFSKGLSSSHRE